jgi:hypothetical protein
VIDFNTLNQALQIDRELFFQFSLAFSRLEYSAKDQGFVTEQANRVGQDLKVDWNSLANRIAPEFEIVLANDAAVRAAATYIEEHPPKKQMQVAGIAQFIDARPQFPSQTQNLMVYLRRIRNNLFHGGKGFMSEQLDRDERLLESGLRLIGAIVECDPRIRRSFYGGIVEPQA